MGFAKFMASATGRAIRVIAGLALVVIGLVAGGGWVALSVVGLVPLVAGAADVCLFGPLFGAPLKGSEVRGR